MAIPEFVVNAYRHNPYASFRFAVFMDNRQVAGVSKIGALKRTTEVIEHREGGDSLTKRKAPGQTKFEAFTMERGVTYDTEFEQWASKVWNTDGGASGVISLRDFRRDLIIQILTEQGKVAKSYKIYNCWVSEYQALPELDANGNAIAIEMMKVENEGWERDPAFEEQEELSF